MQCYEKNATWAECMLDCQDNDWSCKELGERKRCAEKEENCAALQCCNGEGLQCFEKNTTWAECHMGCGKDWTCKELGKRAPVKGCSKAEENCMASKCCDQPGTMCYEKDSFWSACQVACKPGVSWTAKWTCKEHGNRTEEVCTWAGKNCMSSKYCCHPGLKCIKKNDIEAYCTNQVDPNGGWSGEVLGGGRTEFVVTPVEPEKARGTSLFCFMVTLPGSVEDALLQKAREKWTSIFDCDEHFITHSWPTRKQTWVTGWTTLVNSNVFITAWRKVKENGKYAYHDWTVKVDPDAVFFPARLRYHLSALHAPKNFPIYIKNSPITFGFMGAIEVFSKEALDKYFDRDGMALMDEHCLKELGTTSGEDGFMKDCMDILGCGYMTDTNVLNSKAKVTGCGDQNQVTFHPFKDPWGWENCYNQAGR